MPASHICILFLCFAIILSVSNIINLWW